MLRVSLACALLSLCAAATPNYEMEWQLFKKTYEKRFVGKEESRRFEIFKQNLDIIYEHNAKDLGYQLGVNEFAHLDPDEFASIYYGYSKPEGKLWGDLPNLGTHVYSGGPLADSVDWTTKGAVTPVKNQGHCGSCWSFSATGAMEGAWEIATGKSVSLSEQQFVDCDKVDHGCAGGIMESAFKYAMSNNLCTEDSYSYHAKKGICQATNCTVGIPKGGVTGYKDVQHNSMNSLMEALNQQPVSIAIEADKSVFQLYKSGVLSGAACGTKLDHGVLAVGYGTTAGKDYWKVKNSWGPTWGDHGYVMLAKGQAGEGECGLLAQPTYPVVHNVDKVVV